jgi:hypothetical protein
MSAENAIQKLAAKYNLVEGKTNDWYLCHQTHCLTKKGSEKIRQAEGITFTMPQPTVTKVSIMFTATFTGKDGNTAHEIGSCRWDGSANNPAKTHAPELAWKRLIVRGVISLTAPSQGIYGSEELTAEYKQYGHASMAPTPAPVAPAAPAPVAAQPAAAPVAAPDGANTVMIGDQLHTLLPAGSPGMVAWAAELPSQWNQTMAKIAELTRQDRSLWEKKIMDHCGLWEKDGQCYWPSDKFSSYNAMVLHVDTYEGVSKSSAQKASFTLKDARELARDLENNGTVEINVRNVHGFKSIEQIATPGQRQEPMPAEVASMAQGAVGGTTSPKEDEIPF